MPLQNTRLWSASCTSLPSLVFAFNSAIIIIVIIIIVIINYLLSLLLLLLLLLFLLSFIILYYASLNKKENENDYTTYDVEIVCLTMEI